MLSRAEFTKHQHLVKALALYLAKHSLKEAIRLDGKRVCDFNAKDINSKAKKAAPLFEGQAQAAIGWFHRRYDINIHTRRNSLAATKPV